MLVFITSIPTKHKGGSLPGLSKEPRWWCWMPRGEPCILVVITQPSPQGPTRGSRWELSREVQALLRFRDGKTGPWSGRESQEQFSGECNMCWQVGQSWQ